MIQKLPVRPNLEHLKAQAKDLLDAFQHHSPEALQRVRQSLPAARELSGEALAAHALALHDAQSVIAREYGAASWAELRVRVESASAVAANQSAQVDKVLAAMPEALRLALGLAATTSFDKTHWPDRVPLLSMRDALVMPTVTMPLFVGRPRSVAALEAARAGDGFIAIFAQKRFIDETPAAADMHATGTVARVCDTGTMADGTWWAAVQGQCWVRLDALEERGNHTVAKVSALEIRDGDRARTMKLERQLREVAQVSLGIGPMSAEVSGQFEAMAMHQLADLIVARAPASLSEKAGYAAELDLPTRLERALELIGAAGG